MGKSAIFWRQRTAFHWFTKAKNGIRRKFAMMLLSVLCIGPIQAVEKLKVVTAQWQDFTNTDLTGVYFDYLQLVLPADQFPFEVEFTTFGRALAALEKQQADISFGLTGADAPHSLRAAVPYDVDRIIAIYDPKQQGISSFKSLSIQSLATYRLAWNLAYNYGKAIGLDSQGYQVTSPEQGIALVLNHRVDVYLAESGDLNSQEVQTLLKNPSLRQEELLQIPVYVGFSNNARGQALKKKWDERVQLLKENGQLAEFYRKNPSIRAPQIISLAN